MIDLKSFTFEELKEHANRLMGYAPAKDCKPKYGCNKCPCCDVCKAINETLRSIASELVRRLKI